MPKFARALLKTKNRSYYCDQQASIKVRTESILHERKEIVIIFLLEALSGSTNAKTEHSVLKSIIKYYRIFLTEELVFSNFAFYLTFSVTLLFNN